MTSTSQTENWLFETASNSTSLDKNQIPALKQAVMAPDNLHALFLILKNLPEILPIAQQICTLSGYTHFIGETIAPTLETSLCLLKITEKIKSHPLLMHLVPDTEVEPEKAMAGFLESHPLYSILAFQGDATLQKNYRHLQAQIFIASHIIHSYHPENLSQLLTSFRGVRYLGSQKYAQQLGTVPAAPVTAARFSQNTKNCRQDSRLAAARVIIEKSLVGFDQRTSVETAKSKKKGSTTSATKEMKHSESYWVGTERVINPSLTKKETKQYKDVGGSPAELPHPTDFIPVIATSERIYCRSTLQELAFQATQTSHKIAIRNQLSPFAWQELNQFDVSILLQYLTGKITMTKEHPLHAPQIKLLLTLMFWGCCSMTRALNLKFSPASNPRLDAPECIYWEGGKAPFLRLFSPGPELSEESKNRSYKQACPITRHVHIPLADIAHLIICQAINIPTRNFMTESDIFPQDPESIESITKNLRRQLRELNKNFGTRLSPGRISNHLLRNLARWQGENRLKNVTDTKKG